jgi:hypothetical protein
VIIHEGVDKVKTKSPEETPHREDSSPIAEGNYDGSGPGLDKISLAILGALADAPSGLTVSEAAAAISKTLGPGRALMSRSALINERGDWAQLALTAYQSAIASDDIDAVADLLGDLMHWCDRHKMSFNDELYRGRRYYDEEIANPDEC